MRLFDAYLAVDWSSSSQPAPARPAGNAIWVGEMAAGSFEEQYFATRHSCRLHIRRRLLYHAQLGRRVFIGFDFAYGYPTGFAASLGLNEVVPAWRQTWQALTRMVEDDEQNRNNRFQVAASLNAQCGSGGRPPAAPTISTSAERVAAGPFWGHPVGREMATLGRHAPEYPYPMRTGLGLERLRWVERRTQGVQPVWKLYGPGSVGGQCLVGIPTVNQLRFDYELSEYSRVWPFETGFTERPTPDEGPFILHAEIWPNDRIVPRRLFDATLIRDRSQVRAMVSWLNELDGSRGLGRLFGTPEDLISEAVAASVSEEGWIIGVR